MAYQDRRKGSGYVKRKRKQPTKINYDKLKEGLEAKKTVPELAAEQFMSPNQLRTLLHRDPKARKVYDDYTMTYAKMRRNTPVQRYYDRMQRYMKERDKKGLNYSIPSLCAYLHITKNTYYNIMRGGSEAEWIEAKNGDRIFVSTADLFQNFDLMIESSLVDFAVAGKSVGAIFLLKNAYGYRDEKQLNLSKDEPITIEWNEVKTLPEPDKQIEGSQ